MSTQNEDLEKQYALIKRYNVEVNPGGYPTKQQLAEGKKTFLEKLMERVKNGEVRLPDDVDPKDKNYLGGWR